VLFLFLLCYNEISGISGSKWIPIPVEARSKPGNKRGLGIPFDVRALEQEQEQGMDGM